MDIKEDSVVSDISAVVMPSIPDLPKVFTNGSLNHPFCGLNSAYWQKQYFTDHFD